LNEIPIPQFKHAIQATHGARSQLRERVGVVEKFQGETVWAREVLVFELLDHPTAPKCYAWEVDGGVDRGAAREPGRERPGGREGGDRGGGTEWQR
jgi:hypothetical protein